MAIPFEETDALRVESLELVGISRHPTANEADVDDAISGRGIPFGGQRPDAGCRRNAVQRHVVNGRDAAGRCCMRGARESFPLRASRLVHVHVGVDEPWHYNVVTRFDDVVVASRLTEFRHGGNHTVEYVDG